jgi:hypothetical protein
VAGCAGGGGVTERTAAPGEVLRSIAVPELELAFAS